MYINIIPQYSKSEKNYAKQSLCKRRFGHVFRPVHNKPKQAKRSETKIRKGKIY